MGLKQENGIWLFLDNEGPQTKNDNAQENTVALAKRCGLGEKVGIAFYQRLSVIDDIWGDYGKLADIDPEYSAGHTLKVVLPFYKAMDATSLWLSGFAKQSLRVVPHIETVLASLTAQYNVWQISTSYEFFIRAFCEAVGFDFNRARCTFVKGFDEIPITPGEKKLLLDFMREVAQMPLIEYDQETGEVAEEHRDNYNRFTSFIWEMVYHMSVGKLLRTVHPVGQAQKKEAVEKISQEGRAEERGIMYVGDSQTDVEVVKWVAQEGLTMMFNGKGPVFGLSDIAYIGTSAQAILEVAAVFAMGGRRAVLEHYRIPREPVYGGWLAAITPENKEELEKKSVAMRRQFRGVAIGELT